VHARSALLALLAVLAAAWLVVGSGAGPRERALRASAGEASAAPRANAVLVTGEGGEARPRGLAAPEDPEGGVDAPPENDPPAERGGEPLESGRDPPEELAEWCPDPDEQRALLERIGLPADAPLALLLGRMGPPDPLEPGAASARVTLFDDASGKPVASTVVLWRLAAPGNEYWSAGDQAVVRDEVPEGGRTFRGLAAGEHRATCLAERAGAPDPEPFLVSGHTEVTLFLALPSSRPVRARLALDGEVVRHADVHFDALGEDEASRAPTWVVQREVRGEPLLVDVVTESAEWDAGERQWIPLLAGPDGFDLGTFPEDRKAGRRYQRVHFRTSGGVSASTVLHNGEPGHVLRRELDVATGGED